jgi:hypothetical protein
MSLALISAPSAISLSNLALSKVLGEILLNNSFVGIYPSLNEYTINYIGKNCNDKIHNLINTFFNGEIVDFRFYNIILTNIYVNTLFNYGSLTKLN